MLSALSFSFCWVFMSSLCLHLQTLVLLLKRLSFLPTHLIVPSDPPLHGPTISKALQCFSFHSNTLHQHFQHFCCISFTLPDHSSLCLHFWSVVYFAHVSFHSPFTSRPLPLCTTAPYIISAYFADSISAPWSQPLSLIGFSFLLVHLFCVCTSLTTPLEYYWTWKRSRTICLTCNVCQAYKSSTQKPVGLLHSLPIPNKTWGSIAFDFIGPFSEYEGHNYMWVIICWLTSMVNLVQQPQMSWM